VCLSCGASELGRLLGCAGCDPSFYHSLSNALICSSNCSSIIHHWPLRLYLNCLVDSISFQQEPELHYETRRAVLIDDRLGMLGFGHSNSLCSATQMSVYRAVSRVRAAHTDVRHSLNLDTIRVGTVLKCHFIKLSIFKDQ
jgi:hypothetical protein